MKRKEDHWNWQDGKPKCIECGKQLTNYDAKYCRRHKGLRGSNSPHWKGGTGSIRHRLMGKLEYREWRKAVFKRDNYTCVKCRLKGVYLEADHIRSWALYPELRYDVNNGRTLCKLCHIQTDTFPKQLVPKEMRVII